MSLPKILNLIEDNIARSKLEREYHLENNTSYEYYTGVLEALEYVKRLIVNEEKT